LGFFQGLRTGEGCFWHLKAGGAEPLASASVSAAFFLSFLKMSQPAGVRIIVSATDRLSRIELSIKKIYVHLDHAVLKTDN